MMIIGVGEIKSKGKGKVKVKVKRLNARPWALPKPTRFWEKRGKT
jgi:hypothetical protein